MRNPFATDEMAAGYATSRPPIHGRILAEVRRNLSVTVDWALDVGCGAGLSTRALHRWAKRRIGIDPVEAMLRWSATLDVEAEFAVGCAEAIPVADRCIDLITAAGSLNYVDLNAFFSEAGRVLTDFGMIVAYDFSPGRAFHNQAGLEEWYERFEERFPTSAKEARPLDPSTLAGATRVFQLRHAEAVEVALAMTFPAYVDYVMTESNVAAAIRRCVPRREIHSWCEDTLSPVWGADEHDVMFRGYFACMSRARE